MLRLNRIQNFLAIKKQPIRQQYKPELKQVYENYLHSYETRSDEQINATNEHIKKLTQQNLARLNSIKSDTIQLDQQEYKNCIFVCLSGIPPFKNQFDTLNLPGKTYQLVSNGFQLEKDEKQCQKNLHKCKFSQNADNIHRFLQQHPNKDVIFVYHSFGTYNLSVYFHKYGVQRVKGLIQIGVAPVRQYLYISQMYKHTRHYTQQDIRKNKNEMAGEGLSALMKRMNKELNVVWDNFPSPVYGAAFLHYFKSPQCPILFDLNRRYPNILKLMIFGEEDKLFEKDLMCERASFYGKQKLNFQAELKKKFNKTSGITTQNLQQNFIYMIPGGRHSIHLQKRQQPILRKAVQEYLSLIFS